jgi:hypothetical protein
MHVGSIGPREMKSEGPRRGSLIPEVYMPIWHYTPLICSYQRMQRGNSMKREVWAGYAPPLQNQVCEFNLRIFFVGFSTRRLRRQKRKVFGRDSKLTLASHAVGIAGLLFRQNSRTRMKSRMKWTTYCTVYCM